MRHWVPVLLALLLAAPMARAEPSETCRAYCASMPGYRGQTPAVQAQCFSRCAAGEAFSQQQQALPVPAPATAPVVSRPVVPSAPIVAAPHPVARPTAPASARREATPLPAPGPPALPATAPPRPETQHPGAQAAPTVPVSAASRPIQDPPPAPLQYGAFHLARPPSLRYGFSVGQRNPQAAEEQAEATCRTLTGTCVPVAEFTEACIAVVEGIRRVGLFITSDPNTYRVQAITHGVASNPADAQEAAMRDCAGREGGRLTCRLRQAACGAR